MIHSNFRVGTVFTICENIGAFVLTEMANSEVRLDNHLYLDWINSYEHKLNLKHAFHEENGVTESVEIYLIGKIAIFKIDPINIKSK